MASTHIRKPESLHHALEHHAEPLVEIVGVLAVGILLELQPRGWDLKQIKKGAQSFMLKKGDLQYHFRGVVGDDGKYRAIRVIDRWMNGSEVAVLDGRVDALRFIRERVAES